MSNFLIGRDLYDAHVETFTGDASDTAFTLANSTTTNACIVRINGVVQRNGTDFTVSGTTITFTTAPPNASNNIVVQYFGVGAINVPADNSVTLAKLAPGTDGNLISFDASQNPVAVATGSDGQVLTSTGAGSPPVFETLPADGGWNFVSAVTASGSASVVFAGMATGYDYQIVYSDIQPATDAKHFKCLLGIAGPTYRTSAYYGTASGLSGTAVQSNTETTHIRLSDNNMGTATDEHGRGMITLIDPANSGTDTNYLHQSEYHNSGSGFDFAIGGGHYQTSEANTDIQFLYASGNIATGSFKLYQRANA
tara:strand:- start:1480 stop:2409 length:930 start_codon:yes stop_codon:yes gene_type:complete